MIKLDTSRMPPRIVAALMARGAQLPPLEWHINPSRNAKQTLDEVEDTRALLGREELADPAMADAVRALLYVWNGWPGEAVMTAQLAPDRERAYVEAFCKRQTGDSAAAKDLFRQVGEHPIYTPLGEYAQEMIGRTSLSMLKRLRDMIAFGGQWEPYIFSDAFHQALTSNLDVAGDQIIRNLQCYEFELLFGHCLDAAAGEKLAKYQASTPTTARRTPPPKTPPRRPAQPTPTPTPPKEAPKSEGPKPKAAPKPIATNDVGVMCPKCRKLLTFPESARGSAGRCDECSATFLIPQKAASSPAQP